MYASFNVHIDNSCNMQLQTCKKDGCSYSWIWKNQEVLGRMAVANLQMSAAILFSGVCVAKTERLFAMMKVSNMNYPNI